ncbi:MAG: ABC transporter permease subunit [Propionibacteriales bacterium]|nr:ABC transporter permease subunit [Propionibacteriales bacterium]
MSVVNSGTRPSLSPGQRPGSPRKRQRGPRLDITLAGQSKLAPYLFSAPAIVTVSLLLAYPVLYGLYNSLFRAPSLGAPEEFVGLENYSDMFADPAFWHALVRSAVFVFGCLILGLILGLFFAFALNRVIRQLRFLRAITIAPYIISNVAAAVMFRLVFNSDFGLLNRTIEFFGFDGPGWLSNGTLAMVVVIFCQVWTDLPLTILLLLAGLQTIDTSYLDAARVDGATGWKRAWHLSIPLISPQIVISTVWLSYSTLTGLGVVLALTGGGPLKATQTLPMEMYSTAFTDLEMNEALAIASFILILNALLTLVYVTVARRYGTVE